MLPESQPRPTRPYPVDPLTPPPETRAGDHTDQLVTSYASTLFLLGVMVGLLAILARITQEFQHPAMLDATRIGLSWMTVSTKHSSLPPMIRDLGQPITRMIALGFAICVIGIVLGSGLWLANGKPTTPHERRWTWLGAWIVLWLVIGMGGALLVTVSNTRIALLIVTLALATVGFVVLVMLIVIYSLNHPPP